MDFGRVAGPRKGLIASLCLPFSSGGAVMRPGVSAAEQNLGRTSRCRQAHGMVNTLGRRTDKRKGLAPPVDCRRVGPASTDRPPAECRVYR